ncbi:TPA: YjcZ family sporulation protein [bacterium]|nr:YjcZ family sporulation protein [bacterium]
MNQPCGCQPATPCGLGNTFTLVLVLFILLAIIGCICIW